ncbi:MAG: hypothetical protein JNM98_18650 [Rhodocyclaceae bacterium]|nr:hypothetical protein [Rhodocyclaceae bacterium]
MTVETKEFPDGTTATGLAPLPQFSPRQQDVTEALRHLDDLEAAAGGKSGPSIRLRSTIERLLASNVKVSGLAPSQEDEK